MHVSFNLEILHAGAVKELNQWKTTSTLCSEATQQVPVGPLLPLQYQNFAFAPTE